MYGVNECAKQNNASLLKARWATASNKERNIVSYIYADVPYTYRYVEMIYCNQHDIISDLWDAILKVIVSSDIIIRYKSNKNIVYNYLKWYIIIEQIGENTN